MKKLHRIGVTLAIGLLVATSVRVAAQDDAAPEGQVTLRYLNSNNSVQYLLVKTAVKVGRKVRPLPRQTVEIYLDGSGPENLIGKTTTSADGKALVVIPPALKEVWTSSPKHSFSATMKASKPEWEATTSLDVTRAKIELDTVNTDGTRSINVKVSYLDSNVWKPASDVEMKVGVDRSGSVLSAGDEATYTTDSSGTVPVEFKKEKLPGNQFGQLVLVAKAEDNDKYGTIIAEKTVPWGVAIKVNNDFFNQRALWSTRFRTPYWLLFMAYVIISLVWGTIIYLIFQLVKIKKLSRESAG